MNKNSIIKIIITITILIIIIQRLTFNTNNNIYKDNTDQNNSNDYGDNIINTKIIMTDRQQRKQKSK